MGLQPAPVLGCDISVQNVPPKIPPNPFVGPAPTPPHDLGKVGLNHRFTDRTDAGHGTNLGRP